MRLRMLRKIGILGHYGNGNLGDEAIVAAVIQSVKRHAPDATVVGFCVNPVDTAQRHGIQAFRIRRVVSAPPVGGAGGSQAATTSGEQRSWRESTKQIIKSIPLLNSLAKLIWHLPRTLHTIWREGCFLVTASRTLTGIDLLIVAGSGQLMDGFGGAWAFPYTLFKWSVMARLRKTKLAILSVGAGPINAPLSRFFLRQALRLAHYRSFRDDYSMSLIKSLGVKKADNVFPDLACNLVLGHADVVPTENRSRVVGIIPVPYYDHRYWQKSDPVKYTDFVQKLAQFSLWLLDRGFVVSPFWTKLYTDELVVKDIEKVIKSSNVNQASEGLLSRQISTLDDVIRAMGECDMLVASRFHGILLPLLMQKPVIGLAYHPKTNDMMTYMGQPDYCLSIDDFTVEGLQRMFLQMEERVPIIRSTLKPQALKAAALVEEQYRRVISL